MNIRQFEKMVNNRSMSILEKREIDGHIVYVCDGFDGEKYKTWYAVARDPEKLDIAQRLEFEKYDEVMGIKIPSRKEKRVESAFEHAKEAIPNIKRMPIYAG